MRPDFLVATPTWLSGSARLLDLAGHFDEYNDSQSIEAADAKALFCDWRLIGDTILGALDVFRREPQTPQAK